MTIAGDDDTSRLQTDSSELVGLQGHVTFKAKVADKKIIVLEDSGLLQENAKCYYHVSERKCSRRNVDWPSVQLRDKTIDVGGYAG